MGRERGTNNKLLAHYRLTTPKGCKSVRSPRAKGIRPLETRSE